MSRNLDEYHLVAFDPGGRIGWAHLIVNIRAFTDRRNKVLANVEDWDCGEFEGPELEQCKEASRLIWRARFGEMPYNSPTSVILSVPLQRGDVVSEDFELTQRVGGHNLLSPVRINAILDFECDRWGLKLNLQRRSMRTGVNPTRLKRFGFESPFRRNGEWSTSGKGKDAFAAMQHAIVWLRRKKSKANKRPWRLVD